jgi:hypothetical protein
MRRMILRMTWRTQLIYQHLIQNLEVLKNHFVRETFHQLYYLVLMRINEMIQNVAAGFLENDLSLSLNL